MTPDDLRSAWASQAPADTRDTLRAVRAGSDIWCAVDFEGRRHLLLGVPADTVAPESETRGLQVAVRSHQVEGEVPTDYLDLTSLAPELDDTFAAVAADVIESVKEAPLAERVVALRSALRRWQWFWDVESSQLSIHDALGLFGELWFMNRWVGVSAESVAAWNAIQNARHDFQWPDISVEVKTLGRRNDGAVVHKIAHLDQLAEPESGALRLFSLRVVRDELAGNSLPSLVDTIDSSLGSDLPTREVFVQKLAQRGYNPAFRRDHSTTYRILGEYLYEVTDGFPRLTAGSFLGGLAAGIGDVSYNLDMAACDPWLIATEPGSWSDRP